ncbi:MAG: hypothetical protein R2726_13925 [Acidimicrobiales bacterium]
MTAIDRLSDRLHALASRRLLLASGAVTVVLATTMFATSGRFSLAAIETACTAPAPDVRFTTSADDLASFLAACGDVGRAAYRDLQLLDLAYPAALGLFLGASLALLLPRTVAADHARARLLIAVPLLAAVFDYLENAAAWVLLTRFPDEPSTVLHLLGVASAAKQLASWASALLVLACLAGALVQRVTRHAPVPSSAPEA